MASGGLASTAAVARHRYFAVLQMGVGACLNKHRATINMDIRGVMTELRFLLLKELHDTLYGALACGVHRSYPKSFL